MARRQIPKKIFDGDDLLPDGDRDTRILLYPGDLGAGALFDLFSPRPGRVHGFAGCGAEGILWEICPGQNHRHRAGLGIHRRSDRPHIDGVGVRYHGQLPGCMVPFLCVHDHSGFDGTAYPAARERIGTRACGIARFTN